MATGSACAACANRDQDCLSGGYAKNSDCRAASSTASATMNAVRSVAAAAAANDRGFDQSYACRDRPPLRGFERDKLTETGPDCRQTFSDGSVHPVCVRNLGRAVAVRRSWRLRRAGQVRAVVRSLRSHRVVDIRYRSQRGDVRIDVRRRCQRSHGVVNVSSGCRLGQFRGQERSVRVNRNIALRDRAAVRGYQIQRHIVRRCAAARDNLENRASLARRHLRQTVVASG